MTGRITEIRVAEELAWIVIEDTETAYAEKRFIWSDVIREYGSADRLRQSIWLSLLRDALVHGLIVSVMEDDDSLLTSVTLKGA